MKILLIEDRPEGALMLRYVLGHTMESNVEIRETLGEALEFLSEQKTDVIIMDLHLPDSPNAEQTISEIPILAQSAPVVAITGMPDYTLNGKCIDAGAAAFWEKMDIVKTPVKFRESLERAAFPKV